MSRWIRIRDGRGRDARVRMEPAHRRGRPKLQTLDGRGVEAVRFIKSPLARTYEALRSRCGGDAEFADLLMEEDPEIDLEATGRRTGPTDRVLLDPDGSVLYAAAEVEVISDRDGIETDRRLPADTPANVDGNVALVWTGRLLSRAEAARRFAFSRTLQLRHVDGLTYDFLFGMAQELDRADSLVLVGAGRGGRDPIVLERNGVPHRGFLEGRVDGDRYLLVLHLTNLELVVPVEVPLWSPRNRPAGSRWGRGASRPRAASPTGRWPTTLPPTRGRSRAAIGVYRPPTSPRRSRRVLTSSPRSWTARPGSSALRAARRACYRPAVG